MNSNTNCSKKSKPDRREDIILNGLKVFCEKGYEGTTVDDIVKKTGCSHGLFYHYFKSKKEVFDEVMKKKNSLTFDNINQKFASAKSYKEKLKIIIETMYFNLIHDENSSYYFFFFLTQCFNYGNSQTANIKNDCTSSKNLPSMIEKLFLEGQENGEFAKKYTPKECTSLFLSIVQGATLGYAISPKNLDFKPILPNVNFIVDVFSKGDK